MESVILLLVGVAVGWYLGAKFTTAAYIVSFKRVLDLMRVTDQQLQRLTQANGIETEPVAQQQQVCEVRIEQHQGQLYAYRKHNDTFLGQGADRDTLIERIKQEFQGDVQVMVRDADGAEHIGPIG